MSVNEEEFPEEIILQPVTSENQEILDSVVERNPHDPDGILTPELVVPETTLELSGDFPQESNIVFTVAESDSGPEEIFKVSNEGFFVRGKKVTADYEIYRGFVEWLNASREGSGMEPISIEPSPEELLRMGETDDRSRFEKIREMKHGSIKMSEKMEELISKYRRAGHRVIRETIRVKNEKKERIAVQLNMFGEKVEPEPVLT